MNKLAGLFIGMGLVVGCGTDIANPAMDAPAGQEILSDLSVPAPPTPGTGWQIITPIFEDIQPAMDYEVCTWTNIFADAQTDVKSVAGAQNEPPGHHIIVYYTTITQPGGTQRLCNDSDMATFRLLAGANGEGDLNSAPGNLVFRVPAGAQIVLNHHYLNSTDHVMRGQSAVNVNFADPAGSYIPSGYLAVTNTSLDVPQGDTVQTMHAVIDRPYKIWQTIPHMHQWGKHQIVKTTHHGVVTTQFDLDWDASYAFHPPANKFDPATPMVLDVGDTVDVSCEWNNTAGRDLTFGFEMCVSFFNTIDDNNTGNWANDNGSWGPF